MISVVLHYILYMITGDEAVYALYRTHSTRGYWPAAVYSHSDQFTLDPLLAGIKAEFILDPLYQQPKAEFVLDPLYQLPKTQFQPEAPLREITKR